MELTGHANTTAVARAAVSGDATLDVIAQLVPRLAPTAPVGVINGVAAAQGERRCNGAHNANA
jgi:hypothetical protein